MASNLKRAVELTRKYKPSLFDSGIGARLPAAYRKFYDEWKNTPPQPVNFIPHTGNPWVRDEKTGEVKRIENVPLPFRFPKEFNSIITGGEVVIQGFVKKTKYSNRVPRFWMPKVYRSVIYSEICDKYLSALVTKRATELIIHYKGLDTYLFETKACDLMSLLPLKLKRHLLIALSNKDLPYDEEKNNQIYMKYEKYLIPPEEIEWYGLSFTEACRKLQEIEEAEKLRQITPLKHFYRARLLEYLKAEKDGKLIEESANEAGEKQTTHWLKKIPGLRKLKKDT